MSLSSWFAVRRELSPRKRSLLGIGSFLLPLLIWCAVSYVPAIWHPMVMISQPGDVDYFQVDMLVDKQVFKQELADAVAAQVDVRDALDRRVEFRTVDCRSGA